MIAPTLMQANMPVIEDLTAHSQISHSVLPQVLIILGSMIAIALVAVLWAVYIRERPRRHRHRHHWQTHRTDTVNGGTAAPPQSRQRRRSSRGEHSRNPTLAESRGLPPLRDEEPKPPPSF